MSRGLAVSFVVSAVLIGAGSSQAQRPIAPYSSEAAALKAEQGRLKSKEGQLLAALGRCDTKLSDWTSEVNAWLRQWDANERFGQQRSSGEAHRRNHEKYCDTRRKLKRQGNVLKGRFVALERSRNGIEQDLAAARESERRNRERLGELASAPKRPETGLTFDDMVPKTYRK